MEEKDICDIITKALAKDSNVTDRLCLDMRIDQVTYFQQVLSKLNEIDSAIQSGAVVSAGSQRATNSSSNDYEVSAVKEEKYVALDGQEGDDDLSDFGDFIM